MPDGIFQFSFRMWLKFGPIWTELPCRQGDLAGQQTVRPAMSTDRTFRFIKSTEGAAARSNFAFSEEWREEILPPSPPRPHSRQRPRTTTGLPQWGRRIAISRISLPAVIVQKERRFRKKDGGISRAAAQGGYRQNVLVVFYKINDIIMIKRTLER